MSMPSSAYPVNNAGVVAKPGTPQDTEENLDFIFNINLKSVIRLNKLAIPHLEKTRGNIVNVSSIAAIKPLAGVTAYSMSKISLDHYMKIEAPALAKKGIRMNNLNPGYVSTNIVSRIGGPQDFFEKRAQALVTHQIPLGRVGTCLDMAKAVSYLASDDASYVMGTTLVVDGGFVLGGPEIPGLENENEEKL
uniref:NAD(P)-binding protein n=1 Tax=Steinernema glaseri TaxID=37863 RepID=A0A1I7ZX33_9BILA